jgi:hypothetical protein
MAKKMSRIVGIYVRIDMLLHQGEVVMGELTFTRMAGKIHCIAKLDENGCIDPCLVGWGASGNVRMMHSIPPLAGR